MVSHKISDQTARNDLVDLENRGLLIRAKAGRSYVWSPAPNFEKVLRPDQDHRAAPNRPGGAA
ncbi:DeoR family transcriptional regulator [Nocardia cyriacigeorgica]|uniref:DeoR family transcriptional regulator n=2 Tax=Nocardia cyriacigeorgica TaxID=135487 RepID=A0A6P1DA76_9NOCA|nr:DeoR family transcriptional regulator [Nocardia cyriacigeorgica]NEW47028.1 DeoR family transcriptional regulator [Nocardia cyriacigeorgica]NEW52634.1 DeoR family transcriptional regulator [Nocardia cyriacigeorgica]NEW57664.1 DeoR family transcriptional regulator [Nocardia cyriacigeorgica]